jgi:hypothetical protein
MLEAHEMKKVVLRENRARLAEEFEAEYPEIVEELGSIIEEAAKSGDDRVEFLLEGKMREIENKIEKYLTNKGYRANLDLSDWPKSEQVPNKPCKLYFPPEFHKLVIKF